MKKLLTFLVLSLLAQTTVMPQANSSGKLYTTLDTVYTPPGFPLGNLMATICIPIKVNGAAVVCAHGADGVPYTRGDLIVWCDSLAAHGYLAMTIDYYSFSYADTVDTNACYPLQARTLKTGVEFLRKNAKRFQIDEDKIAGLGVSAGSVHWGQCLPWDNDDAFFQTDPGIDDHLNAAVLLYGYYEYNNLPDWIKQPILQNHFALHPDLRDTKATCLANVSRITTPILLMHGKADDIVPYEQSVAFYDSLQVHGKRSELILFDSVGHGFELDWDSTYTNSWFTKKGLIAKDSALAFLQRVFFTPTGIASSHGQFPSGFSLMQNYPNPFNPATTIIYEIPVKGLVSLKVYDLLGREVRTLVNEIKDAGRYQVTMDASNLASGVYFYSIKAGVFSKTMKLMIVK